MKTLFQAVMVVFLATLMNIYAQECIIVQDGNDVTVYYSNFLDEAINDAQSGATIYLAGGNYHFCETTTIIDKELHIVGAGGTVKGTPITNRTRISSPFKLRPGSEGSTFMGISTTEFQANVNNITIQRCYFELIRPEAHIYEWFAM